MSEVEKAFDKAAQALRIAQSRLDRSRSKANKIAFAEATEAFDAALEAQIAERETMERAHARAERAARFKAEPAEPTQYSLF